MKISTSRSDNGLTVRIWLLGLPDSPTGIRRDSYCLEFALGSGIAVGEGLLDIGLPVMQLQRNVVRFESGIRDHFRQLQGNEELTERIAEAVALVGLGELAGLELKAKGEEGESESSGNALLAYMEFLSFTGKSAIAVPATPSAERRPHIKVPPNIAEAAHEIGILAKKNGTFHAGSALTVKSGETCSALDSFELMESDFASFGIALPTGYEAIDAGVAADALRAVQCPSASAVCFYGDKLHPSHRERLQAAGSMPLLAAMFSEFMELSQAIDNQRKLNPSVMELTGLSAGKLKRIRKLTSPPPEKALVEFGDSLQGQDALGVDRDRRFSLGAKMHLDEALRIFRNFDAAWVPDNDGSWACFKDISSACILPFSQHLDIPIVDFFQMSGGNWEKFHSGLANSAGIAAKDFDRSRIALATNDAMEAIDDFCVSVFLPHILAAIAGTGQPIPRPSTHDIVSAREISLKLLVGKARNPAGTLLEIGRNWISRIPALMEADEHDRHVAETGQTSLLHEQNWPALADDYPAKNGLIVRNLASVGALKEESRRLKHCAGRLYVRKCRSGASQIFSVQNAAGSDSLATFEVEPPTSKYDEAARSELRIVQKKGFRNAKPDEACRAAIDEWLNSVKSGSLTLNLERTIDWRLQISRSANASASFESERSAEQEWNSFLSPNWTRENTRAKIWREWTGHILKGSLARAESPGIIFRDHKSRQFARNLSPQSASELDAH
ncbi:MAG: PcfJ domain-containing protein [Albidovulum sp.]|nr:PcfJ domain-containing protein [Albidovulum sp.]